MYACKAACMQRSTRMGVEGECRRAINAVGRWAAQGAAASVAGCGGLWLVLSIVFFVSVLKLKLNLIFIALFVVSLQPVSNMQYATIVNAHHKWALG